MEKQKTPYTLTAILKRLFPYFIAEKNRFLLTFVFVGLKIASDLFLLLMCRSILSVIESWVKGNARGGAHSIAYLVSHTIAMDTSSFTAADLPWLVGIMGSVVIAFFSVGYFRSFIPAKLISNVTFAMRRALYDHLQCLDLFFFDRTRSGEITSRLISDISQGVQVFGMTLTIFIFQLIVFCFSVVFMTRVSVPMTLLVTSVGVLILINMLLFVPQLRDRSLAVQKKLGVISGMANERFGGIKVMQSFTNEDMELERFTEQIDNHRSLTINLARLSSFTGIFSQSIPLVGNTAILGMGAFLVLSGKLTLADLTFLWMMRDHILNPFQIFSNLGEQVAIGLGGLERVFEFFDERSSIKDMPGAVPVKQVNGAVEFRDVSFSYPSERGQEVLSHLSFRVEPGMSAAFVGASGAGKTTAVDLLSRFYDPTSGGIFIDGRDIREFEVESLRDNIGVVMQEAILFSGTIRENIRYGRPDARDDEINAALKMANAWNFVAEMREGTETVIGERGVMLSGGQRQRIAIARAFLKNPRILVLDEATSALDSVSEHYVQEAIERLLKGRTTLIIAHRLSTIAHVDKILVLEKGRLVEEGSHTELIAKNGTYAAFHAQQFGKGKGA
ncbi:MAG: ABC transporter ATP-binding protein [Spirochaetes bacterium]|nr:ABC transporter ATP-binding protein [Spirochaetota bacterium]